MTAVNSLRDKHETMKCFPMKKKRWDKFSHSYYITNNSLSLEIVVGLIGHQHFIVFRKRALLSGR